MEDDHVGESALGSIMLCLHSILLLFMSTTRPVSMAQSCSLEHTQDLAGASQGCCSGVAQATAGHCLRQAGGRASPVLRHRLRHPTAEWRYIFLCDCKVPMIHTSWVTGLHASSRETALYWSMWECSFSAVSLSLTGIEDQGGQEVLSSWHCPQAHPRKHHKLKFELLAVR